MNKNRIESLGFYLLAFLPILDYGISTIILVIAITLNVYFNGVRINILWLFTAYFLYIFFVSLLFSDVDLIFKRLVHSASILFIPVLMASKGLDEREVLNFSKLYLLVISLKALICLIKIVQEPDFIGGGVIPLFGVDFHATYFSYQILIGVILCYYFISKPINVLLILFFSILIVLLQKKISIIALLIFLVPKIKKLNIKEVLFVIGGLTLTVVLLYNTSYLVKIRSTFNTLINFNLAGPDKVRLRLNEAAFANIKEAPIFGKGIAEHFSFFSNYNLKHLGEWAVTYDPHNYFLLILCSGGFIGFCMFLFPFILLLVKSWKKSMALFSFLIITLVFNLTESLLYRYNGAVIYTVMLVFFYKFWELDNSYLPKINFQIIRPIYRGKNSKVLPNS